MESYIPHLFILYSSLYMLKVFFDIIKKYFYNIIYENEWRLSL